jgi:hypothetical protein
MKKIIFDDIVLEDKSIWTQVCDECSDKYSELGNLDETPINLMCGVSGCNSEAKFYLDILKKDFNNEK